MKEKPSLRTPAVRAVFASLPILFLFAVSECSFIQKREDVKRCKFQLAGVESVDYSILDPGKLALKLKLRIANPNPSEAILEPFDWRLLVDEIPIADGRQTEQISIPAGSEKEFSLSVQANMVKLARKAAAAVLQGEANYRFLATVHIGTLLGGVDYDVVLEEGRWSAGKGFENGTEK